ncbi:MAG: HesA/MoeB/ThiF family protein [Bacillota bacterium]
MKKRVQKNLGVFSPEEMETISDKTVIIVGLGGLGSMVANGLVRLGVRRFVLIDHDRYEATNMNRQLFCTEETLGMLKVLAAEEALHRIDSDVDIKVYAERFENLPPSVFHRADLIVDALDFITLKLQLERIASRHEAPLLHGAIGGWYGQAGLSMPSSRLLERYYKRTDSGVENEEGSPTFTPGVVANIMVGEAAKVLSENESGLYNRLLFIDLLDHDFRTITLKEMAEPAS